MAPSFEPDRTGGTFGNWKQTRTILATDWDGVVIQSERAKLGRHLLAAFNVLGCVPAASADLIGAVGARNPSALQAVRELFVQHDAHLTYCVDYLGGASRRDTAAAVGKYVAEQFDVSCAPSHVAEILQVGERISEPLLEAMSAPLLRNLRFFAKYQQHRLMSGQPEAPLLVVTQTTYDTLASQVGWTAADGSSFWYSYGHLLRSITAGRQFTSCAGDLKSSANPKTDAYLALAKKHELRPDQIITFEDTKAGAEAAKEAGLYCIGIRSEKSKQDLRAADVELVGTLDQLYELELVQHFVLQPPPRVIEFIRHRVHGGRMAS